MAQLTPTTGETAQAENTLINATQANSDQVASAPSNDKYRFWLSFTALLLSILFGVLGVGTFAAGQGLALEHTDPVKVDETIFLFKMIGTVVLGITIGCLWIAYKLRPGGG
ncbi:hypothetical protein [Kordiimonas aquimaris]|uniref:hypothetical protein n=1 Tax=Kordiimonas aquimaris TaxID=707591 RepID=UPI0021D0208F|nr:hypothetical protein [Kordiimonas aquimaris]